MPLDIEQLRNALLQRYRETGFADRAAFWEAMRAEAAAKAEEEPILGSYFHATILNHMNFRSALSFRLASKLDNPMLPHHAHPRRDRRGHVR